MALNLDAYFESVDKLSEQFIDRLRKAVAIPSISAEPERRPEVVQMSNFLKSELEALGAYVEVRPLGPQPCSEHLELPPVIVARYGSDFNKRTILVYGHYDVQPASKADGWATEPFELTMDQQGRMFGRGSTDDKGPVLAWLNSIQAHQAAGMEYPVNLLMCFEGMEEYGSEGLEDFIKAEAKEGGFFTSVDAVCISDNYWLGTERPCLTYGLRGLNIYSVTVSGPAADLHSGLFGGATHEPMTDLMHVLASLVDAKGNIQVPGIMEMVAPVTDDERTLYADISYSMADLYEALGSKTSIHEDATRTLMARWRFPSLSVHGIEGDANTRTVIPAKVIGKFSIRTVPNMDSGKLEVAVFKYVRHVFSKLGSKNALDIILLHESPWWIASTRHWNFAAAAKATEHVHGIKPDMTREGGSIPIAVIFEQTTGKNVLLLPMGSSTDSAHSINEKLDRRNYIQGIKLLGAYLHYAAQEPINE